MRTTTLHVLVAAGLAVPRLAFGAPSGAELYGLNCSACHQADAAGAAGQAPPLRNRVDKIAATPEGRAYLSDVLTHGMSGLIEAGGDTYVGYMPSFAQLKDEDIAAILSYLSALGDSHPPPVLAASDIAAGRSRSLTAAAVAQQRKALAAQHPLP